MPDSNFHFTRPTAMRDHTHLIRQPATALPWKALVLAAATLCMGLAQAQTSPQPAASNAELAARLEALSRELAELKARLAAPAPAVAPVAAPAATAPVPTLVNGPGAGAGEGAASETVWGGYGEINYNRFMHDRSQDSADLRRLVLGMNHRFDARTQLVTEIEFEHAVTSADDVGEVAIEQAYIERELTGPWALRAGLFLMPSGLLNENHEPTAFYGVERNLVETAIIPSTWREGGVQLLGNLEGGWRLQAGVSTSFDLSKWDSTDAETAESPLGATHQELAQAHARDLAAFGALNWRGLPGLQLGGSWFRGGAGQQQAAAAGGHLSVTLWDLHARYTPGAWDLSAVYAQGSISGTAAFNTLTLSSGPDWYPVPKRFSGAYVQAAYKLWQQEDYALKPFARWERANTREAYADLGAGLTPEAAPTETVRTVGLNLDVGSHVVLKADLQYRKVDTARNRVGLGLGWSY
jgi:hypothetical protein